MIVEAEEMTETVGIQTCMHQRERATESERAREREPEREGERKKEREGTHVHTHARAYARAHTHTGAASMVGPLCLCWSALIERLASHYRMCSLTTL